MADGSITQDELNSLFAELEELPPDYKTDTAQHIWLVKSDDYHGGIFGGRNFTYWQAQQLLAKVQKDYPGVKAKIIQVK